MTDDWEPGENWPWRWMDRQVRRWEAEDTREADLWFIRRVTEITEQQDNMHDPTGLLAIYLQLIDDDDPHHEQTPWGKDREGPFDIRYLREDAVIQELRSLRDRLGVMTAADARAHLDAMMHDMIYKWDRSYTPQTR